tara:strand:- start:259 stop:570 length:312 start_codon:yes stop_codon:yes gene_type:complete
MKDEDKTFENERQFMKEVDERAEDRGPNDLEFVISDYKKQLYEMQQYKSQAIQLENQLQGSKNIIEDFAKAIRALKEDNLIHLKEIDRLNEYVQILEMEKKTN